MIGDLRHRVTFESKQLTDEDDGGKAVTWIPGPTVWANVQPLSGFMQMQAEQAQTRRTHTVTIRKGVVPGLNQANMRIKFVKDGATRYFAIKGLVELQEANRYVRIDCEESAPS